MKICFPTVLTQCNSMLGFARWKWLHGPCSQPLYLLDGIVFHPVYINSLTIQCCVKCECPSDCVVA